MSKDTDEAVRRSNSAIIKRCSCPHPYQDKRYGRGRRVHNSRGMKSGKGSRCTVCSSNKD